MGRVNTLVDLLHTKSKAKSLRQGPAIKAAGSLCSLNLIICKGARQVKVERSTLSEEEIEAVLYISSTVLSLPFTQIE